MMRIYHSEQLFITTYKFRGDFKEDDNPFDNKVEEIRGKLTRTIQLLR